MRSGTSGISTAVHPAWTAFSHCSLLCHCSVAITLCLCAVQAGLLVPLLFLTVLFRQAAVGIFDKPQKVLSLRGAADLDKHDKVGLRLSCTSGAVWRGHPARPGSSTILLPLVTCHVKGWHAALLPSSKSLAVGCWPQLLCDFSECVADCSALSQQQLNGGQSVGGWVLLLC